MEVNGRQWWGEGSTSGARSEGIQRGEGCFLSKSYDLIG